MKFPTYEQFAKNVAEHTIKINIDDGLFRDFTVSREDTINQHYNITTRKGYLFFTGDMGSFTFKRCDDMLEFFRQKDPSNINPGYWHEKVEAANSRGGCKSFDSENAEAVLLKELEEFVSSFEITDEAKEEATEYVENIVGFNTGSEWEFIAAISDWDAESAGGMQIDDFDWHGTEVWSYQYIWCLYAIVHAIKLYDDAKGVKHD